MTHDEFDLCMEKLIAAVGRPIAKETMDVWRQCLQPMEFESLQRGVIATLRDWTFAGFPPIGYVAERCGIPKATVSDDQQAVIAWDTVLRAMRTHGSYVSIDWGDSSTKAAIEAVASDWVGLCAIPSDELIRFVKPKFIEAWKAFRASGVNRGAVSLGILARDASRIGSEQPQPVLIGQQPLPSIGFGVARIEPDARPIRRLQAVGNVAESFSVPDDDEGEVSLADRPEPSAMEVADTAARRDVQRRELAMRWGNQP